MDLGLNRAPDSKREQREHVVTSNTYAWLEDGEEDSGEYDQNPT